ncbi:MAG: branched-chain amino acid ABC transporter permease [Pseudomonadota bacterium]
MDTALLLTQVLNGLQYGLLLFLLAGGLTLVFGILDVINLAHGAFFLMGAFVAAAITLTTGSFLLGILLAAIVAGLFGLILEFAIVKHLYEMDHLDQVLATFGILLCVDAAAHYIFGPAGISIPLPAWLSGSFAFAGAELPAYRVFLVVSGVAIAVGLWLLLTRTRAGILIRAAASDRTMAEVLGIETKLVFAGLFAAGALLAGLAGAFIVPITGATIGMGGQVVILAFVIIIIGGVGSMTGAFAASLIVGLIDTLGRAYLSDILKAVLPADAASAAGPAIGAILIYLVMAIMLAFRPEGLFPPVRR